MLRVGKIVLDNNDVCWKQRLHWQKYSVKINSRGTIFTKWTLSITKNRQNECLVQVTAGTRTSDLRKWKVVGFWLFWAEPIKLNAARFQCDIVLHKKAIIIMDTEMQIEAGRMKTANYSNQTGS